MSAMWVIAGAVIGIFAPCQYFGDSGYEVINKDPQSHYALHVFLNAEAHGVMRDYGFSHMDSARHGPYSRLLAAMTAYYGSFNLLNETTFYRKQLDASTWSVDGIDESREYFQRVRRVTIELDKLVEMFAPDLATYGLYPDTAHEWLEECRKVCDVDHATR